MFSALIANQYASPGVAQHAKRLSDIGRAAASIAALINFLVIVGWIFDVRIFTQGLPQLVATRFNAALCALAASACLLLMRDARLTRPVLAVGLSSFVLLFSSATLLQYILEVDFGIDTLFYAESVAGTINPGRMAPNSAMVLIASGVALLLLIKRSSISIKIAQSLAASVMLIATLAIIGYAYGVEYLYRVEDYTSMSLVGALGYLLLGISILLQVPDRGLTHILSRENAGGILARRLTVALMLVPSILGWIAMLGFRQRLYETPFAITLVVIAVIIILSILVYSTSLFLDGIDQRRKEAEFGLERSREELRKLSTHTQQMQEQERIRIAREIHDELGQSLTALKMDVSLVRGKLATTDTALRDKFQGMIALVNSTIKTVQRISTELRPGVLDDLGLAAAIEWQAGEFTERSGIECILKIDYNIEIDADRSTALFRIFQETLTNVARHAQATVVNVTLTESNSKLNLVVADNGRGIDEARLDELASLGLIGMRERAQLFGGSIEITRGENGGTRVRATLPL